jgi:integrase
LEQLKNFSIPADKEILQQVKDVFLFCCYTGLRYSDVLALKHSDVKDDCIEITTVKTLDSLTIELNKHSRAILDKYKDIPFKDGKALPVTSNHKMNDYLREIGQLACFNKPVHETYYIGNERIDEVKPKYELLTMHVARRTFVCSALAKSIAPQVIMKWTGHSDYNSMKPYIDISDAEKKHAMEKFDEDEVFK